MKAKLMTSAIMILLIGSGFIAMQPKKPWVVPDKFIKMPNAVKSDAGTVKEGKELWIKHCQSCHGKSGLGDGTKAAQLKTEPGNFTLAATQQQTDGSIFYKVSEGRDDMPGFKKKLPEAEDIWSIVNYIRTLKK
ncbi:MAG: c-type cytochrome [Ferruginibacter sp.]